MQDWGSVPQAQEAGAESEGGNWVAVRLIGHGGAHHLISAFPEWSLPLWDLLPQSLS